MPETTRWITARLDDEGLHVSVHAQAAFGERDAVVHHDLAPNTAGLADLRTALEGLLDGRAERLDEDVSDAVHEHRIWARNPGEDWHAPLGIADAPEPGTMRGGAAAEKGDEE